MSEDVDLQGIARVASLEEPRGPPRHDLQHLAVGHSGLRVFRFDEPSNEVKVEKTNFIAGQRRSAEDCETDRKSQPGHCRTTGQRDLFVCFVFLSLLKSMIIVKSKGFFSPAFIRFSHFKPAVLPFNERALFAYRLSEETERVYSVSANHSFRFVKRTG